MYKYSIEMYDEKAKQWVTSIREYYISKTSNEFDTKDIPNKRRNFSLISFIITYS